MTLAESLVSSFILVGLVTQTGRLFGDSIQALGKGRLRDGVNAAIHRDLEGVRQLVSTWKVDGSMTTNGQLSYLPDLESCQNGTLASDLLSDNAGVLSTVSVLNQSGGSAALQGIQVARTIGTVVGNENLIQVDYATSGSSSVKAELSTTLVIPAQGWCPS